MGCFAAFGPAVQKGLQYQTGQAAEVDDQPQSNAPQGDDVTEPSSYKEESDTEKDAAEQGNGGIASVVARIVADGVYPLDDGVPVAKGEKKSQQGEENTHPCQDEMKTYPVRVEAHEMLIGRCGGGGTRAAR